MCNGFGWLRRDGWIGRAQAKKKRAVPFFALDCQYWEGVSIKGGSGASAAWTYLVITWKGSYLRTL